MLQLKSLLSSRCPERTTVFVLLLCCIGTLRANDTLSIVKNRRFGIGVTSNLISHTGWTDTKPYFIARRLVPFFTRACVQNGVSVNWNFYKNFYIESGGIFDTEDIPEVADNFNFSPVGPNNQSVRLSYKIKYFQIPFGVSYLTKKSTGFYSAIGIKNNFIYYENLNGFKMGVYDTTSNEIEFSSLTVFLNLGGNVFLLKNRLRFAYFFSMESSPIYQEKNGIANFSFYKFGFSNVALFYNF